MLGPKRKEVKENWRKLHSEGKHDFYSSLNTVRSESHCVLRFRYGKDSGLYRRSWTSLTTPFISAQRLSERRSAESVRE
jgi:hypothetical protein